MLARGNAAALQFCIHNHDLWAVLGCCLDGLLRGIGERDNLNIAFPIKILAQRSRDHPITISKDHLNATLHGDSFHQ